MIVPSIDLSALVNTTLITINQKDWVLVMYPHHHCIMGCIPSYAGLPTSTLPAASKQCYLGQFFLVTSKAYPSPGRVLLVWEKTHLPIVKYPHHKCHKVLMTQDVYIYSQ